MNFTNLLQFISDTEKTKEKNIFKFMIPSKITLFKHNRSTTIPSIPIESREMKFLHNHIEFNYDL